ncbi:MAG: hypothetical protein ACRBK7_25690 [Acidimicrobiales bacterium]
MTYPSYSYLPETTLAQALHLARELHGASSDISRLAHGASGYGLYGSAGRSGDKSVATANWIGPHRETFESLFENEMQSVRATERALEIEADAWARFWARAINARNDRLYDQAMLSYHDAMMVYRHQSEAYHEASDGDPADQRYLSPPSLPSAPSRRPFVVAPTAASGYQPTG